MKRFTFLASLMMFASIAMAQDVITLKTGEDINAKVIEIGSTEIKYKKWNNQDGPTYSQSISEVFSIKYQNGDKDIFNATATPKQNNVSTVSVQNNYALPGNDAAISSGYKGFVETGITFGDWTMFSLTTSHGAQLGSHFFIGGGAGFQIVDGVALFPIFGNFRVNFIDSKITPYFDAKIGYAPGAGEGFMTDVMIGCRFGFTDKLALRLSAGYKLQYAEVVHYGYYSNYYYTDNIGGFSLNLGFEF